MRTRMGVSGISVDSFVAMATSRHRDGLVEHRPVQSQLPCYLHKGIEIDRLPDVTVCMKVAGLDQIVPLCRRRQNDDRYVLRAFVPAKALQDFQTADPRQFEIEQDHDRLLARVAAGVAPFPEQILERLD